MNQKRKITLYMDVYPGMDPELAFATTRPTNKMSGVPRYAITVEVPWFDDHVQAMQVHSVTEVDQDAAA